MTQVALAKLGYESKVIDLNNLKMIELFEFRENSIQYLVNSIEY